MYTNSMVSSRELSTGIAALSTREIDVVHVRDRFFLSAYSTGSYLTTGVESRTLTDSPPANACPVEVETAHGST